MSDMTRDAAERIIALELGEGITQENICMAQEVARAYLSLLELLAEAIARFRSDGQTIFADYLERQVQSGEGER
jgi:hypothetical protein